VNHSLQKTSESSEARRHVASNEERGAVNHGFPRGTGPRIFSVSSGKGGVGKTLTSVHLAAALRAQGMAVLVLDADLGLANVDVVLGLQPKATLHDVIEGRRQFKDIIIDGPQGMRIIPSGSGIRDMTSLSALQRISLTTGLQSLNEDFDAIVIDTGAGIGDNVTHFASIADTPIIVTTPEPHAMTDAYAVIKVLNEVNAQEKFFLLVNMTSSQSEALKVCQRISGVADRFLGVDIQFAGNIPFDHDVQSAVAARKVAGTNWNHTISGQGWLDMSRRVMNEPGREQTQHKDLSGALMKLVSNSRGAFGANAM
jgi:flagellar biosynthesis protein FlhG